MIRYFIRTVVTCDDCPIFYKVVGDTRLWLQCVRRYGCSWGTCIRSATRKEILRYRFNQTKKTLRDN
jgi:hypothetical protein